MKNSKTNETILLIFAFLYTILQGNGIYLTTLATGFHLRWVMSCTLTAVMCFCLYFSYRNHAKNVMKPLLGAALMLLLSEEMYGSCYYLEDMSWQELFGQNNAMAFFVVFQIAILLVVAAINVIHYVINITHHSSPRMVRTNHILCVAFVVLVLAQCVASVLIPDDVKLVVGSCLATCSDIFMLAIIARIEFSLDEFRVNREHKAKDAE